MPVRVSDVEKRLRDLPEEQLDTVLSFIDALLAADETSALTLLASEQVLARDWLRPEEDEAWADL